jgi:hypothetical protein
MKLPFADPYFHTSELSKPNIASKGPLLPRTVLVPARQALQSKPLVEEVVAEEKPTCIQSHPGNREFQFTLAVPKLVGPLYRSPDDTPL